MQRGRYGGIEGNEKDAQNLYLSVRSTAAQTSRSSSMYQLNASWYQLMC